MPRLCEFYPDICLATEEKARKNLSQGKKILSQVKKDLSQSTVYILLKHPHITKPTQTHIQSIGPTHRYVMLHFVLCCGVILICYNSVFIGDAEL